MNNRIYVVRSGKIEMYVYASSIRDAWRKFFKSLKRSDIWRIGFLAKLTTPEGDVYLMRTVPALFMLGLIDRNTAVRAIMKIFISDVEEAEVLLQRYCLKDSWVVSDGEDRETEKTVRRYNKLR